MSWSNDSVMIIMENPIIRRIHIALSVFQLETLEQQRNELENQNLITNSKICGNCTVRFVFHTPQNEFVSYLAVYASNLQTYSHNRRLAGVRGWK